MSNNLISDEFGLSFSLNNDTDTLTGTDCVEVLSKNISKVGDILKSSLGPNGMDKMIVTADNDLVLSNDGYTILHNYITNNNHIFTLLKNLSQSQDTEIGDGTTSIVLFANRLLQEGVKLLKKNIHPIRIADGFNKILRKMLEEIENNYTEEISINNNNNINNNFNNYLIKAASTALNSKIAHAFKNLPEIVVQSILSQINNNNNINNISLENINVKILHSNSSNTITLVHGVALEKQTVGEIKKKEGKSKILLLSCPLEPPKLKTKSKLLISNSDQYNELSNYEKSTFNSMISKIKEINCDLVLCQWGFDDEATSMLLKHNLPAIRWVGGHEMGHIAKLSGSKIVSRFDQVDASVLGECNIDIINSNITNNTIVTLTNDISDIKTILINSSNKYIAHEIERSITDAMSAVRSILGNNKIVYGGGSLEINMFRWIRSYVKNLNNCVSNSAEEERIIINAFGSAMLEIPLVLAENAGYSNEYVEEIIKTSNNNNSSNNNKFTGISITNSVIVNNNMKNENIFESYESKKRQYTMATDLVCGILKIEEVVKK